MTPELFKFITELSLADKKTLSQKGLKTSEEVGELAKAILPYDNADGTRHRFVESHEVLEEVADVMLCALSIAISLNYTQERIEQMLDVKAKYWQSLQKEAAGVKEEIPFEIHVTIKTPKSEDRLNAFRQACEQLGVKATILELRDQDGKYQNTDVMTSSVFKGTNASVLAEIKRIKDGLQRRTFRVEREKIETVPWHPAAPTALNKRKMPTDCYFESHYELASDTVGTVNMRLLKLLIQRDNAQFSVNEKRNGQTMITLRSGSGTKEDHEAKAKALVEDMNDLGVKIMNTNNEFSIFDTNILHDADWIVGSPTMQYPAAVKSLMKKSSYEGCTPSDLMAG